MLSQFLLPDGKSVLRGHLFQDETAWSELLQIKGRRRTTVGGLCADQLTQIVSQSYWFHNVSSRISATNVDVLTCACSSYNIFSSSSSRSQQKANWWRVNLTACRTVKVRNVTTIRQAPSSKFLNGHILGTAFNSISLYRTHIIYCSVEATHIFVWWCLGIINLY